MSYLLVLKILINFCPDGRYKIIEARDIISALPGKFRIDFDALDNILDYLDRREYISIKYDDNGVYSLCVLPLGYEFNEKGKQKSEMQKISLSLKSIFFIFLVCFISSFLGCMLGIIIFF